MSDFIEFRHLRYILAIAESGNITRAAEHLFLAQPSLSKQIKDLEEEIGDAIFERTRDGVRPTIVGQVLIDYAKKALLERKTVLEITKTIHRVRETPLRLGFRLLLIQGCSNSFGSLMQGCFLSASYNLRAYTFTQALLAILIFACNEATGYTGRYRRFHTPKGAPNQTSKLHV